MALAALLVAACSPPPKPTPAPYVDPTPAQELPVPPPRPMPKGEPVTPVIKPPLPPKPKAILVLHSKYDHLFQEAVSRWGCVSAWELAWGQMMAESGGKERAVSGAGARGLMQFMPKTWEEITRQAGRGLVDPYDVENQIDLACRYLRNMRNVWKSERPRDDRENLAFGSYNAGPGNLIQAQRACGMPALYEPIMACLHLITGDKNAEETRHYAPRIRRFAKQKMMGA